MADLVHTTTGSLSPVGNIVPTHLGQHYTNTMGVVGEQSYVSTGLTSNDWFKLGSGSSSGNYIPGSRVQDQVDVGSSGGTLILSSNFDVYHVKTFEQTDLTIRLPDLSGDPAATPVFRLFIDGSTAINSIISQNSDVSTNTTNNFGDILTLFTGSETVLLEIFRFPLDMGASVWRVRELMPAVVL